MNFKLFIALLLIFLLSIPCVFGADNWNTFGYDFNRTSYSPETINITNWGQIWNFTGFDFSDDNIIVADGHVVFGSESPDAFLVLNATTGTEICRVNTTSDALDCSHENGIVYGALGTGNVTAFYINNCTQIWNFSTGGNIYRSNTLIVGDFIYIGNDKNYTYAINKTDGTEIWSFDVPGANFRTRPVYYNDTVYIGDSLSPYKMYAINATDGSELWNVTVGTSLLYGGAVLYPSGDDAYIAWGSYDNHIYVLNSSDGAEVCNYSVPYGDVYLAAPAYHSDTLYFGSSSNMYAINATNCSLT